MKVNLLINSGDVRNDYLNIDPFAAPGDADRTQGDVANLDGFVADAEATSLIALDVIDFMPAPDTVDIISGWVKKLRHGGEITIGGIDVREVAKALLSQRLDIGTANGLLHGAQRAPWEYRKSTLTLQHAISLLSGQGLRVVKANQANFYYYVTARRA